MREHSYNIQKGMRNRKKNRIIIVRPFGNKGGQCVLSLMCRLLREKGYDAKVFLIPYEPQYCLMPFKKRMVHLLSFVKNYLLFTVKRLKTIRILKTNHDTSSEEYYLNVYLYAGTKETFNFLFNRKNTIVIYPEKVFGNFLLAKKVVRYIMYFSNFESNKTFSQSDLFICFREVFNDKLLNPTGKRIVFNYFDSTLYRQYNWGERKGVCYFIRKGRNRADLPASFDGPIIDNYSEIDKVKILNECEYCYLYDTQTFYSAIASVCGCVPIVVPERGKTKEDYLGKDTTSYGIAYGDSKEEISFARNTRAELIDSLSFDESNERNVLRLIEVLTERFGELRTISKIS